MGNSFHPVSHPWRLDYRSVFFSLIVAGFFNHGWQSGFYYEAIRSYKMGTASKSIDQPSLDAPLKEEAIRKVTYENPANILHHGSKPNSPC